MGKKIQQVQSNQALYNIMFTILKEGPLQFITIAS